MFRFKRLYLLIFLALSACIPPPTTSKQSSDTLVQGKIKYVQNEPFTHPTAFEFTQDSHAVIGLYYSVSALGDGPSELVAETEIKNITGFPIAYRINGEPEAAFSKRGDYFLRAEIFSGAGNKLAVGDLISESFTPVVSSLFTASDLSAVEIAVTGLESCDSPDVGGFCL